jgi:membrane fusion protein (multidrug efflux system)
VVGADDKVSLRKVKPGDQVDNLWIIDNGVQAGEEVVTDGLQKIKDGIEVKPQAATDEGSPPLPTAPPPERPRG